MAAAFEVTINEELSPKEAEKIRKTLQKSLGKWFKQGMDITVSQK